MTPRAADRSRLACGGRRTAKHLLSIIQTVAEKRTRRGFCRPIDLETGQKNTNTDDELSYQESQGYHLLVPVSGTLLGVYGSLQPTQEDCLAARMSTAPIAAESLSPGAYLCYRTPQGLPGWLLLDSFDPNDFSLSFDFLTWAAP